MVGNHIFTYINESTVPTIVVKPESHLFRILLANAAFLKVTSKRWEDIKNESITKLLSSWSTAKDGGNAQVFEQILIESFEKKKEVSQSFSRALSDHNLSEKVQIQVKVCPLFQSNGDVEFLIVSVFPEIPYAFTQNGISFFTAERNLFEFHFNPMVLIDFEGKIKEANNSFLHFFDVTEHFLSNQKLDQFISVKHPRKKIQEILEEKMNHSFFIESKNGLKKWVNFHSNTIPWEGETFIAVTIEDQTLAHEKEDLLRLSTSRSKMTVEVAKIGYFEFDFQKNNSSWSDELYAIWEVDPDKFDMTLESFIETIYPEDRSILFDFYQQLELGNLLDTIDFRIQTKSGIKHIQQHHDSELDLDGNKVVYGVAQDVTERIKLQNEIEKLELRYQQIFQLSPLPMWVFSIDTYRFLDVNQAAVEVYGYSRTEFLQKTLLDLLPEKDFSKLKKAVQKEIVKQKNGSYRNIRHIKKNGEIIFVEVQSSQMSFQQQGAVLAVIKDVTDEMKTELELNRMNNKLLLSQQIADVGYWEYSTKTKLFQWTPHLFEVLEVDAETFIPSIDSIRPFILPEDHYLLSRTFLATFDSANYTNIEHVILTGEGNLKWILQRIRIRDIDNEGEKIIEGIIQDITDRKHKEDELRRINNRYLIAMKAAKEAIWDWNPQTDETIWSIGFSEIFGYAVDNGITNNNLWSSNIHPNDKERVEHYFQQVIQDTTRENFEMEYEFQRADGTFAKVLDRGFLIRNEEGKLERVIGSMMDISERQEYIQYIHDQNERLKEIAWKQSHEVRAPLTKLISLVYLLKRRGNNIQFLERNIEDEIIHSASELDNVIRSIVRKTEKNLNN